MAQRSAAAAIRAWSLCIDVRHGTPLRAWIVPQLAHVRLSARPFRAENGLWPSGDAVVPMVV
jgi:hypothetical protein